MGSHILSWGLFEVFEGVVRKMCTFDNWNIKIYISRRVIALWIFWWIFYFFLYFLLANLTNSCLNVEDCNSYNFTFFLINIHWTIVATTWRATKLETNNFKWYNLSFLQQPTSKLKFG